MAFSGVIEPRGVHSGGHLSGQLAVPTPLWLPFFFYALSVIFVALAAWGVIIAMLHHYRRAFSPPAEPSQIQPASIA